MSNDLYTSYDESGTDTGSSSNSDDGNFYTKAFSSFTFPVREGGWVTLLFWFVLASVLGIGAMIPLLGIVPALFLGGFYTAYLFRVIESSARGDASMPEWPDYTDFFGSILVPLFQFPAVLLVALGPAIALQLAGLPLVGLLALLVGLALFPGLLISVALRRSVVGANPLRAIEGLTTVPVAYLFTSLLVGVVFVVSDTASEFLAGTLGIPGLILGMVVSIHVAFVEARILGLFYYHHRNELAWMGE